MKNLSETHSKSVVLNVEGFHKGVRSNFWHSGPYICKQRLKYGHHKFFSVQSLKCLKLNNKYLGHHPKLVLGHFYVVKILH